MFVDKLEVFGFKSFSQRLELTFGSGISGVIGPNGCGKSNIVDAFRWVLGEQSSKQLRGDKMEDVIFNGTRDTRPLSMAEVHLTLVNDKGLLPIEYDQVTIGRRLYRSGQSEYTLNKQACRLKDIKDLFLDTGMGSHAYSVIERQMVDNVLSDTTGHRRFLFEEASGIMKYKSRKKEALGKLEATQTDLTRLSDIIHEVERETESLKRQVGKAERYRELRDRLRGLDLALFHRKLTELSARLESLADSGETLSKAEQEALAVLTAAEGSLETLRLQALQADRALSGAREDLSRLDAEITERNHRIVVLREREGSTRQRIEAARERIAVLGLRREENQAEAVRAEESLRGHEAQLVVEKERLAAQDDRFRELDRQYRGRREEVGRKKQLSLDLFQERLKREGDLRQCVAELEQIETARGQIDAERGTLAQRRAEVARKLADCREQAEALAREAADRAAEVDDLLVRIADAERTAREAQESEGRLRQQAAGVTSTLSTLEGLRKSYDGFDPGVRRIMLDQGAEPGVLGTVADLVRVPAEWVAALRPVLAASLQHVVTADQATARRLIERLEADEAGYVTFLPLDRLGGRDGRHLLPAHPGVIGQARHFVQAPPEARSLVEHLLGDVLVVDTLERAVELANDPAFAGWRFVTAGGALLDGIRLGGGRGGDTRADLLEREREIATLREELAALESEVARHERARQEAEGERIVAEGTLDELRRTIAALHADRALREAEAGRLEGERNGVEEREADLVLREASFAARRGALEENRRRLDEALAAASTDSQAAESQYRDEERELLRLEAERESAQGALNETRIAVATREAAQSECRERIERVRATAREIELDNERCVIEVHEGEERLVELAGQVEAEASIVETLHSGRAARVDTVAEREAVVAGLTLDVDRAEAAAREARRASAELREQAHGEELLRTELRAEYRNLEVRLYEDHDQTPAELFASPREWPLAESGEPRPLEEVDAEVAELKEKIKRLGPVNLLAIEEYEERSTRLAFMKGQFADLIAARDSLHEAIGQINTTASELFMDTFRKVQENFQKTFLVLFQGGECSLSLVGDDPLECEIEIMARPRGKRPQSIAQLSSGERALTAIALLFAIYLVKPSPFCILDEVDAPLDDANVDRFVAMIREFSERTQFIVITHNKKTMEACDTLYGVTMQTPGVSQVVSVRLSDADQVLEGRRVAATRPGRIEAREQLPALVMAGAAEAPATAEVGNGRGNGHGDTNGHAEANGHGNDAAADGTPSPASDTIPQ